MQWAPGDIGAGLVYGDGMRRHIGLFLRTVCFVFVQKFADRKEGALAEKN
jgi:hypothetical protein